MHACMQANRWVKAMENRRGLRCLKANEAHLLRTLESCVRVGTPVLLEDVGESLDPALDTLMQKQTFMQGAEGREGEGRGGEEGSLLTLPWTL